MANEVFIPANDLHVIVGSEVRHAADGSTIILPGNRDFVLYGPYMSVEAGIYSLNINAAIESGQDAYFDVYSETRVHASRWFSAPFEVFVHLYRTDMLEFRFKAQGQGIVVSGLKLERIVADDEEYTLDQLLEFTERLLGADSEARAIFRLIDRIGQLSPTSAAQLREQYIEKAVSIKRLVAERFGYVNCPASALVEDVKSTPLSLDEVKGVVASWTYKAIDLISLNGESRLELGCQGIQIEYLSATLYHRAYDAPARSWHLIKDETLTGTEWTPRPALFERFTEMDRSYEWELATGRGMKAYCPFTGVRLTSRHGFCIPVGRTPCIFYRFEGKEVFYVVTGNVSGSRLLIYIPLRRLIINIADTWLRSLSTIEIVEAFNVCSILNYQKTRAYLAQPPTLAAVTGSNNFGHFIWVCLAGLSNAIDTGVHENLTALVGIESYPISAQRMFPELAKLPFKHFSFKDGSNAVFEHFLDNQLLPVFFAEAQITAAFSDRVRSAAFKEGNGDLQCPQDVRRPLIWINLRAHSKVWVDQADGYANILNKLAQDFGAASAFLDGWTDCNDVADEIRG